MARVYKEFQEIILDESWLYFTSVEQCNMLKIILKMIRSYGGSVTVLMQCASDAMGTLAAKTLFHSIGNQIYLEQGNIAILKQEKDLMHLTDEEIKQISELKTIKGESAKIFIKMNGTHRSVQDILTNTGHRHLTG